MYEFKTLICRFQSEKKPFSVETVKIGRVHSEETPLSKTDRIINAKD